MAAKVKILVVDDDEVTRKLLKEVLEKSGYETLLAQSGEEAVSLLKGLEHGANPFILSDIKMQKTDGINVLREAKKINANSVVILMTGFGSMGGAIEAIQEGAFDYVSKPFNMNDLKQIVARAVKHWETLMSVKTPNAPVNGAFVQSHGLIGKSPKIVDVYKTLARAAMSSSMVLVTGESGTGKELVARAIHSNSPRRDKKFVAVNCGSLSDTLLESELFGHLRGAFTGAIAEKKGLFEEASGGTLFLDEIGDISPALQVKLLRVLQEGEVMPVGATQPRSVDVRLIAATHRDLDQLVKSEKFREDLYYRLKVISIELPPLRERMEDLPDLIEYFLAKYAAKNKKSISHLSEDAMLLLMKYAWPGNVRELEHSIERAVALNQSSILFPEDFPAEIRRTSLDPVEQTAVPASANKELKRELEKFDLEDLEKNHIIKMLQQANFNKSKASELLGIDRATLYRKAQRYGIDLRRSSD